MAQIKYQSILKAMIVSNKCQKYETLGNQLCICFEKLIVQQIEYNEKFRNIIYQIESKHREDRVLILYKGP